MIEIRLPALDDSGQPSLEEALPAEAVEAGLFRLLASPGLVERRRVTEVWSCESFVRLSMA